MTHVKQKLQTQNDMRHWHIISTVKPGWTYNHLLKLNLAFEGAVGPPPD